MAYLDLQYNPLVKGIIVGFLVSLLVFAGGIYVWRQLSTVDLRLAANKPATIVIGNTHLNFTYHPESKNITMIIGNDQAHDFPANKGIVGSGPWGRHTLTQVTPDYAVLHFTPWQFSSIDDVTQR